MIAAALPSSVDLTADAMPAGNQGAVGSCAAWATSYTALGYWENKESISGGALEPMYSYSQVDGGIDNGSSIEGNLAIAKAQGIDIQSDYWQGNFDYTDQPTAAEKANAVSWKLSNFSDLSTVQSSTSAVTQASIETALAAGDPVVIGIPVYENFFGIGSAGNGYYAGISGSFAGYHAVTALGYNANGLVIENSWGNGWGDNGFATLSWTFVNSDVFDAVSVGPLVTGGPVSTTAPVVTGTVDVGQSLSATSGSWLPAATSYAYQWQSAPAGSSNWSSINGATSATYTPAGAVLGDDLSVVVTATSGSGSGSGSASSAATGPVGPAIPSNVTAPTVSGTLLVGQTLTATAGSWNPAASSYAYQWQRSTNGGESWSAISGATGATYTTSTSDAGAQERVVVTGANSSGSATGTSAAVGPVSGAPYAVTGLAITGTTTRGSTLTASSGTWSPAAISFSYQWQRSADGTSWASISGATGPAYTLGVADERSVMHVVITATNAAGATTATTAATAAVTAVPPLDAVLPKLSGTVAVSAKLTTTAGTWSGLGNTYAYQWQLSSGSGWSNISGATGSSYTILSTDAGHTVRVVVTATNPDGSVSADSAASAKVPTPAKSGTASTVKSSRAVRAIQYRGKGSAKPAKRR